MASSSLSSQLHALLLDAGVDDLRGLPELLLEIAFLEDCFKNLHRAADPFVKFSSLIRGMEEAGALPEGFDPNCAVVGVTFGENSATLTHQNFVDLYNTATDAGRLFLLEVQG